MIQAPVVINGPGRDGTGVLLIGTPDRCALPCVGLPDRWLPDAIGVGSRMLARCLRRKAIIMRYLRLDEGVACEGELLDDASALPAGMFWASSLAAARDIVIRDRDRLLLQRWPAQIGANADARAPWERPGWYASACAWIDDRLHAAAVERRGRITQVKGGWSESCVLRVPTASGVRYFKAGAADGPEARVLQALSPSRSPRGDRAPVPRIAAVDATRNWLLLHDAGGREIDRASRAECRGAAQGFARLQIAEGRDIPRWLAAGAKDYRLDRMLVEYRRLIEPLPPAYAHLDHKLDRAALRTAGRRAEALCTALASQGLPDTLINADFSPANVRVTGVTGDRFIYLDWADAMVGHPFFAMVQFLQYLHGLRAGADAASDFDEISEGYFEVWREAGFKADVDACLTLACTLIVVLLAVRWHHALLRAHPQSLWASQVALARREALEKCLELRSA